MQTAIWAIAGLVLLSPPSGRPPVGPLTRFEPRVYDVRFEVTINTDVPFGPDDPRNPINKRAARDWRFGDVFEVADAPIVMPLIFRGAYSAIKNDSVRAELWLGQTLDRDLPGRLRIDDGLPHHGHLAVLPIVRFRGKTIRWSVSYRAQSFSSRIDDRRAAEIPWPREWPAEVGDGLKPQAYIESDDPIFKATVDRVSEGQLHLVPPYLAARDLVRYCINELQVTGDGVHRGRMRVLHGMELVGAARAARDGRGSPHDLVCVCVAVLRAAGIPARPVIGVEEDKRGRNTFVTWAEFYLPSAGWVPFDPDVMRGKGIRHRDVHQPWPEFGTMDDLNRRVPLAYHFLPPRAV